MKLLLFRYAATALAFILFDVVANTLISIVPGVSLHPFVGVIIALVLAGIGART
jgi:hypothetical protein